MMKEIILFFLVVSIIFLIKELYSFIKHLFFVRMLFSVQPESNTDNRYKISVLRQFGLLFTISYIITFLIS